MRSFCKLTMMAGPALLLLLVAPTARGMPQQDSKASAKDILAKAAGSSYGQDKGAVDGGVLAEIFGTSAAVTPSSEKQGSDNYGPPNAQVEDDRYDNCSYYKSDGYECVPYYQCKGGKIITDGGGLIDIRSGFGNVELDPLNSKCGSYLEVCCRLEDFDGQPVPTRPPITRPPTTARPQPAKFVSRCGRRNYNGLGVRIQNEQDGGTQFGEWPHMCAVLKKTRSGGKEVNLYVCGASLIAPNVVLTGAHCVHDVEAYQLKVRCGEWDTQQTIEPVQHADRDAKYISVHPGFNEGNLQEDFALVHLEEDFVLSPHIDTMCLPNQFASHDDQFRFEDCFATGWGKDKFGKEGEYQVILKQVEMDVVPQGECEDRLRETRLGRGFNLDRSFMCAGGEPGKDTCKGDGGGPLVCPIHIADAARAPHPGGSSRDGLYVQAGIVAWGIGCGGNVPGVYANVSTALCFIDWATKCQDGQDVDSYGIFGCHRWAKRTYCQNKAEVDNLKFELDRIVDIRQKGQAFRKMKKLEGLLKPFEEAIQNCLTGPQDFNCEHYDYLESDDLDLSGNARATEEGNGDEAVASSGRVLDAK